MNWMSLLAIIAAGALAWLIFRIIRGRPDQFSKENLSKSFYTMGILGLMLIVFVAFLVLLLKAG